MAVYMHLFSCIMCISPIVCGRVYAFCCAGLDYSGGQLLLKSSELFTVIRLCLLFCGGKVSLGFAL